MQPIPSQQTNRADAPDAIALPYFDICQRAALTAVNQNCQRTITSACTTEPNSEGWKQNYGAYFPDCLVYFRTSKNTVSDRAKGITTPYRQINASDEQQGGGPNSDLPRRGSVAERHFSHADREWCLLNLRVAALRRRVIGSKYQIPKPMIQRIRTNPKP